MSWSIYIQDLSRDVCESCGSKVKVTAKCCYTDICRECFSKWPDINVNTGKHLNYTSNTTGMLQAAAEGSACVPLEYSISSDSKEEAKTYQYVGEAFDGKNCRDIGKRLRKCIAWMLDHSTEMEAMNPANGWGSYTRYLKFLQEWAALCEEYPDCTVYICR